MNININQENLKSIEAFKLLLQKDESTIVNEALNLYFKEMQEQLEAQKDSQTNLSFEEFWDDVEI